MMLTGQSGILSQSVTAKDKTGRANIIEEAQRDIREKTIKEQDDIDKEELHEILEKYFTNVPDELPDDLSTVVLTSNDGKYDDILASEIYGGTFEKKSIVDETKKSKIMILNNPSNLKYNAEVQKWIPDVVDELTGEKLTEGIDYNVVYSTDDFINAGDVKITITGIGNYDGVYEENYTITKAELTIEIPSMRKNAGDPDPAFVANLDGLAKNDESKFSFTLYRDPGEGIGKYEIHCGYSTYFSKNYTINMIPGYLTIE